jgi:hypothetical protein
VPCSDVSSADSSGHDSNDTNRSNRLASPRHKLIVTVLAQSRRRRSPKAGQRGGYALRFSSAVGVNGRDLSLTCVELHRGAGKNTPPRSRLPESSRVQVDQGSPLWPFHGALSHGRPEGRAGEDAGSAGGREGRVAPNRGFNEY